jgi:hypothetical protein
VARFESIVRPFARPNSLATRRIAAKSTVEVTPAVISWGTAGTLASAHQIDEVDEEGGGFTVLRCDDEYEEVSGKRLVDVRRIEQTLPDGTTNPDNFIDLERPYRVYFEKKELASQKRGVTQTWVTRFDTQVWSTMKNDNDKCQSKFNLDRNLT